MAPGVQRVNRLQARAPRQTPRPVPVLQRAAIVPYETWRERSSKVGRSRSDLLIAIDAKLMGYHAAVFKTLAEQRNALTELAQAVSNWNRAKQSKYTGTDKDSIRRKDMDELHTQITAKQAELARIPTGTPDVGKRSRFAIDHYNRIRLRVQRLMALPNRAIAEPTRVTLATGLADLREPLRPIEADHATVNAIWDACSMLIGLGEARLKVQVSATSTPSLPTESRKPLERYRARYERTLAAAKQDHDQKRASNSKLPKHMVTALQTMETDIAMFTALLGKSLEPDGDPHEFYSAVADLADEGGNAIGMQGTGGKGNEGIQEYYNTEESVACNDPDRGAKLWAAKVMSGLHDPDNPGGMAVLSGVGDGISALALEAKLINTAATQFEIIKAAKIRLDADPDDAKAKRQILGARLRLATLATAGSTAVLGKMLGGALHGATASGSLPSSTFFSDHGSTDLSTDFKLAGDAGTTVLSAVDSIDSVVTTIKNIFKRAKKVDGDTKTTVEKGMDVFDSAYEISGSVNALKNTYTGVARMYEQISSGGQVANASHSKDVVRGVVGDVPIVPIIGLVFSCMTAVKQGLKLGRAGVAATRAKEQAKTLIANHSEAMFEAFAVTREVFLKQINRSIIDLLHALSGIAAGAMNVTGLGAGIGAAVSMTSMSLKLVQIGVRTFKQHMRDRKAGDMTNLERGATADHLGFTSYALEKAQGAKGSKFNKDKSTANKEYRYNFAALEILRAPAADQKWFLDALGLRRKMKDLSNKHEKSSQAYNSAALTLIIKALKER